MDTTEESILQQEFQKLSERKRTTPYGAHLNEEIEQLVE